MLQNMIYAMFRERLFLTEAAWMIGDFGESLAHDRVRVNEWTSPTFPLYLVTNCSSWWQRTKMTQEIKSEM
jgi:hypothetical protein